MKKLLIIAAAALAIATPAAAQNAGAGAVAGAGAEAGAAASAGSQSIVVLNSGGNGYDANGNPIGSAAAPLTSTLNYSGSYTVKNNPGLAGIGAITAHTCALSNGGTASGAGFGFGLSTTYVDENCERLAQAAALNAVFGKSAAATHLAGNPQMCATIRSIGQLPANTPCTKAEKDAAAKAAKAAAQPKKSTRVASTTNTPKRAYAKCAYDRAANKITFRAKFGANKATAKSQCMSALGL